jgi:hypothetical protein
MAETVGVMQQSASRMAQIDAYVQHHNIPPVNVQQSIELCQLEANDPEAFLERITEIQETYSIALGKKLPSDLQEEVDGGLITVERAKELTQKRLESSQLKQTVEQRDTRDQPQADDRHIGFAQRHKREHPTWAKT